MRLAAIIALIFSLLTFWQLPTPALAQTGDYFVTWQATDLLVARLMHPSYQENQISCHNWTLGDYGRPANSEVAVGVHRWQVRGNIGGSDKFKELWVTPDFPSSFTYTGDFVNGRCTNGRPVVKGNSDPMDWLLGWLDNQTLGVSAYEFRSVPVTQTNIGHHNVDPDSFANIGRTTSCQNDGGNNTGRCTFATGPYAWQTFHMLQTASDGKHTNVGVLIPLSWNVTGLLCSAGDKRCD